MIKADLFPSKRVSCKKFCVPEGDLCLTSDSPLVFRDFFFPS